MMVAYALTLEDCYAFARYQWRQPNIRRRLLATNLVYALIAGALFAFFFLRNYARSLDFRILVILLGMVIATILAVLVFCIFIDVSWTRYKIGREFKRQEQPENIDLHISPEGVFIKGQHGEYLTKWSGIKRIADTKDHIFFYFDDIYATTIPKRCFNNPNDIDGFLTSAKLFHESIRTNIVI